jgi:hypothetical protein
VRRIRIERPTVRRERSRLDVLPLEPRDPDILRAKAIDRSGDQPYDTDTGSRTNRDKEVINT